MADQVLFEAGDGLSESAIGTFFGQPNIVDYVVRGVSSSVDFGNNTVDYTQGELVVTDSNNQAYLLEADARSGLSLTDSATNHVFVEYDPTTDDAISFTINTTGTSPTDPHIKIEEIDTSADTSTEFNRNPDVGIDQLTDDVDADGNDINNVGALGTEQAAIGDSRTETTKIEDFDEDADDTTNLSLSMSGIGSFDEVELVIVVNGNSGGNTADVSVQINGVSSSYKQHVLSSGTVTEETSQSQWAYEQWDNFEERNRLKLSVGDAQVYIKQLTGSSVDRNNIVNGSVDESAINSVSVSTGFNASGRAYVKGVSDS